MEKSKEKILRAPLRISISILIIGSLFKIQHWPYANIIIVSAFSLIAILYAFRFFQKEKKIVLDYVKVVLVIFWSINGIFTILHWPYKIIFQTITLISLIVWTIIVAMNYINNDKTNKKERSNATLNNILFSIAALLISVGVIFKIMHWPGAVFPLITGMILGIVWLLKGINQKT